MRIEDFTRKNNYWTAFWEKEVIDRPLICVTAPKEGRAGEGYAKSTRFPGQACLSRQYDTYLDEFKRITDATYFGGEAMPFLNPTIGPDQYAAFLGAKLEIKEEYDTSWVHSIVNDWEGFKVEIDKNKDSYFNRMKEFIAYTTAYANGEFLVGMLDLHSNMDALSALRGPQDLCYDLMDCPGEVHRVLNDVRKTYADVFMTMYEAGDMKQTGSIGWIPCYCPKGKFASIQCDFAYLVSPSQAREFIIPALEEEAAFLDHCIYHYDGKEALGIVDDILGIKEIDAIQWVPGDGQPRSIEWMDLLKKIQKAGKGLQIYDWTIPEIIEHFKELSPEGLFFCVQASSQKEADDLIKTVKARM
jgi:hypothetical protein